MSTTTNFKDELLAKKYQDLLISKGYIDLSEYKCRKESLPLCV